MRVLQDKGQNYSGVQQASPENASAPPIVHDVLNSAGRPLDAATRQFMEPRFGHDFSNVRIHTGSQAAESARAVNALAYTVGHNVVFGSGQYAPATQAGRQLLAHELAHAVQQEGQTPAQLSRKCGPRVMGQPQRIATSQKFQLPTNRRDSASCLT